MQIKAKLEKLELVLRQRKAPVLEHFNPGLTKQDVEAFLNEHGIVPIPSLVALYEWHNGVKTVYGFIDRVLEILPFGKLFNLNEMIKMREVFKEWAYEDFSDLDNYIPFLGSGESDMFLLNLTTEEVLCYQPMILTFGELVFRSINTMLDCIIECYEKDAFTIGQDGFEVNFDKYIQIQESYLARTEGA